MKKLFLLLFISFFVVFSFSAQTDDELFFSDDDLFGDDGIVEIDTAPSSDAQNALNHGSLFTDGSIKLGGSFETSISTVTKVYSQGGTPSPHPSLRNFSGGDERNSSSPQPPQALVSP